MKKMLRRHGNRAAWASLCLVLAGAAAFTCFQALYPQWFCHAVNPGGKEFVCGADYSLPLVNVARWAYRLLFGGLYLVGMASLPYGGTRSGGKAVLAMLTVLIAVSVLYTFEHRHDDWP